MGALEKNLEALRRSSAGVGLKIIYGMRRGLPAECRVVMHDCRSTPALMASVVERFGE